MHDYNDIIKIANEMADNIDINSNAKEVSVPNLSSELLRPYDIPKELMEDVASAHIPIRQPTPVPTKPIRTKQVAKHEPKTNEGIRPQLGIRTLQL